MKPTTRTSRHPKGIKINDNFINRFNKCGFDQLYIYCISNNSDLMERILSSIDWLYESKRETKLSSAIVKTSIALETLLIFSDTESLSRSLSERSAFILSPRLETRKKISKIIRNFYDARSGVVHGNKNKMKKATPELLESVDRLLIFLLIIVSANIDTWPTIKNLHLWCDEQRWGAPWRELKIPFNSSYITRAIKLSKKISL